MEGEELSFECQELPVTTQHTFDEGLFETQLPILFLLNSTEISRGLLMFFKRHFLKNASEFVIFWEYETLP